MSTSTDKKIVQMTFDNAQFERGVKDTLVSLKRLRESLDFKGATKGMEDVAKATKNFKMDGMTSAIEAVSQRFSAMGIVGMTVIQNLTNSSVNMLKGIITAVPSQIVNGGWARAMKIEDARFKIKGLKADWDALYEDMQYAVDGTAYGLDAAANAAAQLSASGVKAGDDMKTALRGISGVAAMTNSTYDEIGRVFSQVAGAGRLMGQDLLQISSRGINAAATLAEYLNKTGQAAGATEADVREMISKGQIDFATFAAAMDDAFGEHAKDANETFAGSLANVRAALSKVGEVFARPIIQTMPDVFNAIRISINNVKEAILPFAEKMDPIIRAGIKRVAEIITIVSETLTPVTKKVEKVKEAVEPAIEATQKAGEVVSKTAEEIDNLANAVMRGEFGDGAERMEKLGDSYYAVQNRVNELMGSSKRYEETQAELADATEQATKANEKHAESVTKASVKMKEANDNYSLLRRSILAIKDSVQNIGSVFKSIGEAAAGAVKRVVNMGVGKQVTRLLESIAQLTAAFKLNETQTKNLENTFTGVLTIYKLLGDAILFVVRAMMILAKPVIDLGKAFLSITGYVGNLIGKFGEFTNKADVGNKALSRLRDAVQQVEDAIAGGVKEYTDFLKKNEDIKKAVTTVKDAFKNLRDRILDATGKIDDHTKHQSMLSTVLGGISTVLAKLLIGVTTVVAKIINGTSAIKDTITQSKLFNTVADGVRRTLDRLTTVFKLHNVQAKEYGGVAETNEKKTWKLNNVLETIRNTVLKVIKGIRDFGKAFIELPAVQKVIEGVKSAVDAIYPVLETAFTNTIDWISTLIEKLSGVKPGSFEANMSIINSAIDGMSTAFQNASANMSNFFNSFSLGNGILSQIATTFHMSHVNAQELKNDIADVAGNGGGSGDVKFDIKEKLKETARAIADFNSEHNVLGKGIALGVTAALYKTINDTNKAVQLAASLPANMGKVLKSLSGVFDELSLNLQAFRRRQMLKSIVAAILALGALTAALSFIPPDKLQQGINATEKLVLLIGGLFTVFYGINSMPFLEVINLRVNDMMKNLLRLSLLLGVLAAVSVELGKVKTVRPEALIAITTMMVAMGTIMALLIKVGDHASKAERKVNKNAIMQAIAIAGSIYILVIALKKASSMNNDEIMRGLRAIIPLLATMGLIVTASNRTAKANTAGLRGCMSCALSIYLLLVVMKKAANEDASQIYRGFVNILPCIGALALCMKAAHLAGESAKGVGPAMLGASAAIILVLEAMKIAASMSMDEVLRGGAVVTTIAAGLSMMMVAVKGVNFDKTAAAAIIALSGMVVAVIGELIALTFVDTKSLAVATVSLTAVLIALGHTMKEMASLSESATALGVGDLFKIGVILGMITGVIAILIKLSTNPWESIAASCAGMTLVLLAMGHTFDAIAKTDGRKVTPQKMKKFLELCIPLAAIAAAILVLSKYGGSWESMLASATAMSEVLLVMGTTFAIIGRIPPVSPKVMTTFALGVGGVGVIAAAIIGVLSNLGGDPASMIAAATSVSELLLAFAGVFAVIAVVGPLAEGAVAGAAAFDAVVAIISGLILGMAAVLKLIDDHFGKGTVKEMMGVLEDFFRGVGNAIGALVESFATHMINLIPKIGAALSQFILLAMPGLSALGTIGNKKTLEGAKALAATLLVFGAATFVEAITNLFPISKYFAEKSLQDTLKNIAKMMVTFDKETSKIKDEKGLKNKAQAAADLMSALGNIPTDGGVLGLLTGDTDFEGAANFIETLGKTLKKFDKITQPINDKNVKSKIKLLNTFMDTLKKTPAEGGLLSAIMGSKGEGYKSFASGLKSLGKAMAKFQDATTGIDDKAVKSHAKTLSALIDALSKCKADGGLFSMLMGSQKKGFTAMATGLTSLGKAMKKFADSMGKKFNKEAFNSGMDSLVHMMEAMKKAPTKGGLIGWIMGGTKDFSAISTFLISAASGMQVFADTAANIKDYKSFNKLVNALETIMNSLKKSEKVKDFDFASLMQNIVAGINTGVKSSVGDVEAAGQALYDALRKGFYHPHLARDAAETVSNNIVKGFKSRTKAAKTAGQALYDAFRSGAYHPHLANDVGSGVGHGYTSGIRSVNATSAGESLWNEAREGMNHPNKARGIGQNVAEGYANGIMDKLSYVAHAANSLGDKTIKTLKKKLDIHSPSRVGKWLGQMFGVGTGDGVFESGQYVIDKVQNLGDMMIDALETAVDVASSMLLDDIDPVITPRFDMSHVMAARTDLKSIFGNSLDTTINTLSSLRQNGSGSPVGVNETSNTTINNITYNQTNNSPKPLDRYEIYRQTRNQLRGITL